MKNYIFMAIGSLAASCAFANPFSGAYLTGAIGGISTDFQVRGGASISAPGESNILSIPNNPNVYANSILGAIGLGYAYPVRNYIIGIQADANFFNTNKTQTSNFSEIAGILALNSSIKAQLKNSYDILLRPGWLMDPSTLLYGLIGATFGNFHVSQSGNFQENAFLININSNTSSSQSNWRTGFTVGLGVQQNIANNLSAALEYVYTNYGNLSIANNSSSPIVVFGGETAAVNGNVNHARAFTNAISLRLFYNFS